jgi:hypothetical protein
MATSLRIIPDLYRWKASAARLHGFYKAHCAQSIGENPSSVAFTDEKLLMLYYSSQIRQIPRFPSHFDGLLKLIPDLNLIQN